MATREKKKATDEKLPVRRRAYATVVLFSRGYIQRLDGRTMISQSGGGMEVSELDNLSVLPVNASPNILKAIHDGGWIHLVVLHFSNDPETDIERVRDASHILTCHDSQRI